MSQLRGTPNGTLIAISRNGVIDLALVIGNLDGDERWKFMLQNAEWKTRSHLSARWRDAEFIVMQTHDLPRPKLNPIPLGSFQIMQPGQVTLTMTQGQWDALLQANYDRGGVLLELDWSENPVAAYQRPEADLKQGTPHD